MSFAFNFSDPQFSAPELNAPRACAHDSNCYYNGPNGCVFVHPGEEGTGMKIFPSRSVKDQQTGRETWQKATVRLIGGAAFYERRRLKMSWPEWCALPKNSHLPKPHKVSAPSAPSAPSVQLAPSVFTQSQQPFSKLSPEEQFKAMFRDGYAIQTPEIIAARNAFIASFSFNAQQIAINNKAIDDMKHQQMGEALYTIIAPFLAEHEKAMKDAGVWHPKITVGKLTGMLLEGFSYEELSPMLSDMPTLTSNIADCCVLIKAHADESIAV